MAQIWKFGIYFEFNYIKSTIYQNVQDVSKVVLEGKFIALNAYIMKEKKA